MPFILNSRLSSTNSENIKDPNYFRLLPFVTSIFEVPGYLYYEYYINGKSYQIFYSKSENKKYEIDTWNGFLKDDIAGGPDSDLEYCREGKIYSWTGARDLKKYIESEDFAMFSVVKKNFRWRPKLINVLYICKNYLHGLTNTKTQCY